MTWDWKSNALKALDECRRDIEAAKEETFIIAVKIGHQDMIKERPVDFYTSVGNFDVTHRILAFITWRSSLKFGRPDIGQSNAGQTNVRDHP